MSKTQSTAIDIEKQYPSKPQEKEKEKADEPLEGLSGTRWSTVLMVSLWIICIVLMVFVPLNWTGVSCSVSDVEDDDSLEDRCVQHGVVNRVTTAFVIFFVVQCVASIFFINFFDGFWIFKVIGVIGLILLLLLPNTDGFDDEGFQYIARIGGFIFIIFLQILLLDFAYYWKQGVIDKSTTVGQVTEATSSDLMAALRNVWLCGLLIFSILYILIFVVAMCVLYTFFAKDGCHENSTIITISLILMIAALVIQVVLSKNGSIVASGILASYVAYLTYSAVALNPRAECNPTISNTSLYGVGPQVIGLILSFLAILYTSVLVTRRMSAVLTSGGVMTSGFMNVATGSHSGKQATGTEDQLTNNLRTTVFNLNIIFIMLSFYICMTLTNWGTLPKENSDSKSTNAGDTSMWMQACGAWVAIALYILGLIVPNFKFFPTSIWDLRPKM